MIYKYLYKTPDEFSNIMLESDGELLTSLRFIDNEVKIENNSKEIFEDTIKWLDIYFSGKKPQFTPKYKILNETSFRNEVFDVINNVDFGNVISYGDISKIIAKKRNIKRMSSQAVGSALGANPICIIIPCHRVIGANNKLGGYGGGIKNKIALLKLEGVDVNKFTL